MSEKAKGQEPTNPQTQGKQAQQDTILAASEPDSLAPLGSCSAGVGKRETHSLGQPTALQSSLGPPSTRSPARGTQPHLFCAPSQPLLLVGGLGKPSERCIEKG